MTTNELIKKIKNKEARILVVGLGRVGLPTAAVLANLDYDVVGVDLKKELLDKISSGKINLNEPGLRSIIEKVVRSGKFKAATSIGEAAKTADIVIVSVQTPLGKSGKSNMSYLKKACEVLAQGSLNGKLIIVESTVPPGTIKNLVVNLFERESGLKTGKDFWLAYCPERITPGRILQELPMSPRLIGGFDLESTNAASELFKSLTKGEILITDCESAEVAKLAENTFRDVNIAFANELALICERVGVDVIEVIRLANTHPRVQIHRPGPGVGGPCLPKDPHLLLESAKEKGFKSEVIMASRNLNNAMSRHVVDQAIAALEKVGKHVKNSSIVILGVAYKGETDDVTNTPAQEIIHRLMKLGADVRVQDPYSKESFGARRFQDITEAASNTDCLIVVSDHKVYEKLDMKEIKSHMKEKPVIIDCRRIVDPKSAKSQGFLYVGTGNVPLDL